MRLIWHITARDARYVREFVRERVGSKFVRARIERNLRSRPSRVTKASFWRSMIGCLLTTQQRSGPDSAVNRIQRCEPFPLTLDACRTQPRPAAHVRRVLRDFGGIRRAPTIGRQAEANLRLLEGDLWERTVEHLRPLTRRGNAGRERVAAHFIAEYYHGLGPKQSRNLLQDLGLTRYEIPIDSRITKWLNETGFPVRLNAQMLSNSDYYDWVMDGVLVLCRRAGVYPCVLDAAVFSSFDKNGWERRRVPR